MGSEPRTVNESFQVSAKPAPGFTITPTPQTETVNRGDVAAFLLELKSVNGFMGDVTLDCSSLPTGSKCLNFPQGVYLDKEAFAISGVLFPKTTPPGTYRITFTGTSGPIKATAAADFIVK